MEIKTLHFENKNDCPLYLQLYQLCVQQMIEGYIKQGDRMPSVRELSRQLSLSKSTVENAYDKLVSDGYLIAKPKSGYFCDIPTFKLSQSNISTLKRSEEKTIKPKYDFSSGSVEPSHFERKVWRRYMRYVLEDDSLIASYGQNQGELFLREQLCQYLYHSRGVIARQEQLVIGAGIQPLLYLFCSLFREEKLRIGFLNPVFMQASHVFLDCHHEIIVFDNLKKIDASKIDVLYLSTATLHLKIKERMALLSYLKENHVYLIEDDHNGDMHYLTSNVSSLQGTFENNDIFYLSSFSKLLLPSVRMAVMSIPLKFKDIFFERLNTYHQTASKIEQQVLALYIQDGHMERCIKRLKKSYLRKSEIMKEALIKIQPALHFRLLETSLCYEIDGDFDEAFYQRLKENQIAYSKHDAHCLRLYFGGISEEDIPLAIELVFTKK